MSTESTATATHDGDVDDAPAAFAARRAPRISQADVFRAADELLVQGDRPTIDRVRMRLGRGSPNTINDHLDDWWAKLGSRLRDLPGHEFPQLPQRVAHSLQRLWNEALEGAQESLRATLTEREQDICERERALAVRVQQFEVGEQMAAARAAALEESLTLAREQLSAANRRAETLENALRERDAEATRLRARIEASDAVCVELRAQLDVAGTTHRAERTALEERYAAAEKRWLMEVDRARQGAKDAAKEHELIVKELRTQIGPLQTEHDHLRHELVETRAELKMAAAVREQLEERLRALPNPHEGAQTAEPKSRRLRKRKRPMR
jgi:hypothetical protein